MVLSRELIRRKRNMFDVKKEMVEIQNKDETKDVYEITPLTGKYLPDLYAVMDAIQGKEGEQEIIKVLSTEASTKLHRLVFASLENSYPNIDKKQLDQFVSSNLFKFVEAVIKVNMPEN